MYKVLIGTANSKPGPVTTIQDFDSFHDELMFIPEDTTAEKIDERLANTAGALVDAVQQRWSTDFKRIAISQHILSSLGKELFHLRENSGRPNYFHVGWLAIGRLSIDLAEMEKGSDIAGTGAISSTFLTDRGAGRLASQTVKSLEPAGVYDWYALIAGIGSGQIQPSIAPVDSQFEPYNLAHPFN